MLKKVGFLLLLIHLIQVNGQYFHEEEYEDGSGDVALDTIPTDDEDMGDGEGSASGMSPHSIPMENKEKVKVVADPPHLYEEEPEIGNDDVITTTESVTKKVIPPNGVGKVKTAPEPKFTGGEEVVDNVDDEDLEEGDPKDPEIGAAAFTHSSQFMAALIVGGCVGLLFAVCVIMLLAYRMRKKDEGSYALDEKKPSTAYQYTQGQEYYA
uniref:Syndecan n=1 Tax=Ciona savignyi TaxID=51511 RepID=H2YFI2_CIOSA